MGQARGRSSGNDLRVNGRWKSEERWCRLFFMESTEKRKEGDRPRRLFVNNRSNTSSL